MTENIVTRLTRETCSRRAFGMTTVWTFVFTIPAFALFRLILSFDNPWSPVAAYFPLLFLGLAQFLFLAWMKGSSTVDMAKKVMLASGAKLADAPAGTIVGMAVVAVPFLFFYAFSQPGVHQPPLMDSFVFIAYTWFTVAPVETFLQAWVWPMALPYGPITAQIAFALLHGERAFDPLFFFFAVGMGIALWLLTYLRYMNWRGARLFGPVTTWSAHATWNCLVFFVVLGWPQFGIG